MNFFELWHKAATTTLGLFWMAFWAFGLGYLISSMIQVFVTQERMKKSMGSAGVKDVGLATFFGFLSSSCSFAALSTTRSLFAKGAGFVPSLAFLLASTNLVVELGIVIAIFLTWQFVVAEYVGGLMLIGLMWIVVKVTSPHKLIEAGRERAKEKTNLKKQDIPDWQKLIRSKEAWIKVAKRYVMEWKMVWKDVAIGFTVAGVIAAFVPQSFFQALFVGSGSADPAFSDLVLQTLVGPVAAFFTFIGSMGNIPLAAVLFGNGVSFAGIVAFIFSDLVVFPVLRIQAEYYGWKLALYIIGVFLAVLIVTALLLHYGFDWLGMLPDPSKAESVTDREFFAIDYKFYLNVVFVLLSIGALKVKGFVKQSKSDSSWSERILTMCAAISFGWLVGGLVIGLF